MKNKNCPNKDACWDYNASNCEGSAVGQEIEKLNRKIKRLRAENAELRERLDKAIELPYMYEAELVDYAGHFIKTIYVVLYNNNGTILAVQYSYKKVAEARLKEMQGGER